MVQSNHMSSVMNESKTNDAEKCAKTHKSQPSTSQINPAPTQLISMISFQEALKDTLRFRTDSFKSLEELEEQIKWFDAIHKTIKNYKDGQSSKYIVHCALLYMCIEIYSRLCTAL